MDLTTYIGLKNETFVDEKEDGIVVFIPSSWVIEGEDRVSYTTIIRLIECCREYHWIKDVRVRNRNLDSICGTVNTKFIKTIRVNSTIDIKYLIKNASTKKYTIEFIIKDEDGEICCLAEIISFFYNPLLHESIEVSSDLFHVG